MGEVSAGIPAKPSERQSTDPVPTRAQPAESPDDYLDSETGADRDAFQRYLCHTWKRNELPNTGDRRGSEAQRRGEGDAQPAAGDSRPV
jgi:hypothetical protein